MHNHLVWFERRLQIFKLPLQVDLGSTLLLLALLYGEIFRRSSKCIAIGSKGNSRILQALLLRCVNFFGLRSCLRRKLWFEKQSGFWLWWERRIIHFKVLIEGIFWRWEFFDSRVVDQRHAFLFKISKGVILLIVLRRLICHNIRSLLRFSGHLDAARLFRASVSLPHTILC